MKEDIKELMLHYLVRFCEHYELPVKGYSPDFLDVLLAYDWPGNIRELIQALEKAIITAKDEPVLFPKHLPDHIRIHLARAAVLQKRAPAPAPVAGQAAADSNLNLKDFRESEMVRIEKAYLASLMRRTNGDVGEACRVSGLSRSRLYTLLKKYGLKTSG